MITKPLSNRYIQDPTLLVELLKRLFGSDFRIEEKSDSYLLTTPRELTEAEIESISNNPSS